MSDEQQTIQQLLEANEQLKRKLYKRREREDEPPFHLEIPSFPRRLCQLGATLKNQIDGTPNPLADDCFVAALKFVSMSSLVKHRQKSEREAHFALQRLATILNTTVADLPKAASILIDNSQKRDFSPHELLGLDNATRNMIVRAANSCGCPTLAAVADLPDEEFLTLRNCGPAMLRKIRTAFSFGDADEL